MESRELIKWQDEAALCRYQMIAPQLAAGDDSAKRVQLRKAAAEKYGVSERSLRRYEANYRDGGFEALKPKSRNPKPSSRLPEGFEALMAEAVQLKREVPKRSVNRIIFILEQEGRVPPGLLKRSTVERYLYNAGFGRRQMQMYTDAQSSSGKRFCRDHRMELLQGDIKFGPRLPIGKNGAMKQTYLSSLIDDHSRFVVQSRFYACEDAWIVEDTLRKAVLKWGKFDSAYFDHGSQYIAKQLRISLSRLGITIRLAPVRSGKSKGKIEKFHQIVDSFIAEAKAHRIKTLEELNRYWSIYLEEYYHKDPHDGIREYYESKGRPVPDEGITPLQEWGRDSRPLVFIDTSVVAEAFMHHEERLVDKGACISLHGRKYETKASLIGCKVEAAYDPMAPDAVTVSYKGIEPFTAKPVQIGPFCDRKPAIPLSMLEAEPESSRLLDVLEKKDAQSRQRRADAISFGRYRKEGDGNV